MNPRLTERQNAVVALRAQGLHFKEIADRLGLSVGSARGYAQTAARRMGIDARSLVALGAQDQALDILRRHSLILKAWKEKHEAALSAEALAEVNSILIGMVCEWAKLDIPNS